MYSYQLGDFQTEELKGNLKNNQLLLLFEPNLSRTCLHTISSNVLASHCSTKCLI